MKILLPILFIALLTSCASRVKSRYEKVAIYRYVFIYDVDAWEKPTKDSRRLMHFSAGDTVSTETPIKVAEEWKAVELGNYLMYVNKPYTYALNPVISKRRVGDKPAYNAIATYPSYADGLAIRKSRPVNKSNVESEVTTDKSDQTGWGIGIGGSSQKAINIDVLYRAGHHMFQVGYMHQFNGQLGKNKGEQLANYGRTVLGDGTYFSVFTAGYSYWINNRFAVGVDGGIGSSNLYSNFSDKRFLAGGYHMTEASATVTGIGGRVSYLTKSNFMFSGGYNYLSGVNFSIYITPFKAN